MRHVPSQLRLPTIGLLAVAAALAWSVPAAAQAVATATPATPGKPTTVDWNVDGLVPPVSARVPHWLVLEAPGFKLDGERSPAIARGGSGAERVPREEQARHGGAHDHRHRPVDDNEIAFDIVLYRGDKDAVLAVTEFIGTRVIPGRLRKVDGALELTFDPLPEPPVIPGVELSYESRACPSPRRPADGDKGTGAAAGRGKKVRYTSCARRRECQDGTWPTIATLGFPDGSSPSIGGTRRVRLTPGRPTALRALRSTNRCRSARRQRAPHKAASRRRRRRRAPVCATAWEDALDHPASRGASRARARDAHSK